MLAQHLQHWPNIEIALGECPIFDAGPTVKQHWVNVPCLLGSPIRGILFGKKMCKRKSVPVVP